ncbi:Vps5 C terminal like-domain-containing protein [Pelagophyceae sp. CCMP2097]|nr:Vps5 C terminal like-domain-containing protein [Pelagophyceae sp. CCMP2097]
MMDSGAYAQQPGSARQLQISVSDPKKEAEGIHSYVSYKVNTQTNLPEFQYGSFSVIRRYSDFVWLADQLGKDVPGSIVPPLPEKAVVGRFSSDFVESRRRLLEKFVSRVAAHEELSDSKYFKLFLQADDGGLAMAKAEQKALVAAEKKSGLAGISSWFEDSVNSINFTIQQSQEMKEKSPADEKIDEVVAYINNLEVQMGNVAKHTTGLMKRNRELASGLFEFGLAFTLLGQTEADALAAALTKLGHTADQLSLLVNDHVGKETARFEEPLYDYIRVLGAVKAALNARAKHKHALAVALQDLDQKRALAAKLASQPGKEDRAALAEHAVQKAQRDASTARDAFEHVSARVIREMERFKREKAADMRQVVLDYTTVQIEYNKRIEAQWEALLPELHAIPDSPDEYYAPAPPPPPPPADRDLGDLDEDESPDLVGV